MLIHEIGHALGLKHPFSVAEDLDEVAEPPYLYGAEDSSAWTRMSYTVDVTDYSLGLAPFDIAALQYLYGIDASIRPTDDTYVLDDATPGQFVWDGAGHDTLDASGLTQGATLYLEPGRWSHVGATPAARITDPGQFTINFGTRVEDVIGSAHADRLYGNAAANAMDGAGGDDHLDGGEGDDHLSGGEGDDRLDGGEGNDRLDGDDGEDRLTGGRGADWIHGGAGLDVAVFTGPMADYDIEPDPASGALRVVDRVPDRDGTDTLRGIETLSFLDGPIDAPAPSTTSTLQVRAYTWSSHALLPGVVVSPSGERPWSSAPSGGDGRTSLDGLGTGLLPLDVRRDVPSAEAAGTAQAVNLQDAVAILKLVAGAPVNPGDRPLSPYQAIAADVDANGTVSLGDALAVLRHAVGLPGAPAPAWVFLDEGDPAVPQAAVADPTAPGLPAAPEAALPMSDTLGLVGVLRGDVDGSWAPPPGSLVLDEVEPDYFDALVSRLQAGPDGSLFSPTQWGIYPESA